MTASACVAEPRTKKVSDTGLAAGSFRVIARNQRQLWRKIASGRPWPVAVPDTRRLLKFQMMAAFQRSELTLPTRCGRSRFTRADIRYQRGLAPPACEVPPFLDAPEAATQAAEP